MLLRLDLVCRLKAKTLALLSCEKKQPMKRIVNIPECCAFYFKINPVKRLGF